MNQTLSKVLRGFGLHKKQADTYIALLEVGQCTIADLAKHSKINRSSLYSILEELRKLGLVYHANSKSKLRFVAEDPAKLIDNYKHKLEDFEKQVALLETVRKQSTRRSQVLFFDGKEGFKKIWKTILESNISEYLIIIDPQEMLGFIRKGYIKDKIIREKVARGIRSRQLVTSSEYVKEIVQQDVRENRKSKFLPHIYKTPFTTIIFGESVALISPHMENMMFIVESVSFAKTQRALFETLWEKLD